MRFIVRLPGLQLLKVWSRTLKTRCLPWLQAVMTWTISLILQSTLQSYPPTTLTIIKWTWKALAPITVRVALMCSLWTNKISNCWTVNTRPRKTSCMQRYSIMVIKGSSQRTIYFAVNLYSATTWVSSRKTKIILRTSTQGSRYQWHPQKWVALRFN